MRPATVVLVTSALILAGCAKGTPLQPSARLAGATRPEMSNDLRSATEARLGSSEAAPVRNSQVVHVPFFILDAAGGTPTGGSTLLFESRAHNPILAPDGHQVTLAEFNAVQDQASFKCVHKGTHVVQELTGLIPNGVYSIKLLTFKAPGFDGTFRNLIGLGALGSSDGSHSSFVAQADGSGSISAITSGGALSVFGSIADCALTEEFEVHVVGVYHIDG